MKKMIVLLVVMLLTKTLVNAQSENLGNSRAKSLNAKTLETPLSDFSSETCTEWKGYGIQFRQCETDWGHRSHQFYNGYKFQIRIWYYLECTDGTSINGTDWTIDAESESDKAANDNPSGTNKTIKAWRITKKWKKDNNGEWIAF